MMLRQSALYAFASDVGGPSTRAAQILLLIVLCVLWLAAPQKAFAGPIYVYQMFGEVTGSAEAINILDDIEVGTSFSATVRVNTSGCTTIECGDVSARIRLGSLSYEASGVLQAIYKDPPFGVQLLFLPPYFVLPSSTALISPSFVDIQLFGDGILGNLGSPPINAGAFESGAFYYEFFDGRSEKDLKVNITRILLIPEPATFTLLVVGLVGIFLRKRKRSGVSQST